MNNINEAGYNEAPVYGPSEHNPPRDTVDMVEKLRHHLTSITQEEFDEEWKQVTNQGFGGPTMEDFLNQSSQKQVIYNFGYTGFSGSGTISHYPQVFYGSISEFSKWIRTPENIESLFESAKEVPIIPSSLTLQMRIEEEEQYWEYTIKLINVKEYRKYWEIKYNKEWKWNIK